MMAWMLLEFKMMSRLRWVMSVSRHCSLTFCPFLGDAQTCDITKGLSIFDIQSMVALYHMAKGTRWPC